MSLSKDTPQTRSRAFLYGESVFTTMRVEKGHVYFQEAHKKRLFQSAEWLWPGTLSQAEHLWGMQEPPGENGIWRVTLSAQQLQRGVRLLTEPKLEIDGWWTPGLPGEEKWQAKTLKISSRDSEWPSFLKSGDYLSRLVAARKLKEYEVPLFCVNEKICEFMHANVFCWDGKALHTPLAGANVLAGVGRARLMEISQKLKMPIIEREIDVSELPHFSSILAVNAVRGVASMSTIDDRAVLGHASFNDLNKIFFEER
ncbi:MAG: aminotransferase class IV [Bacteriovoracaceae bacterium]|nr:aminotransferase class IV [Bacteriovoracaceae bacterium]